MILYYQAASSRIIQIMDVRRKVESGWITYNFAYNSDAIPHLTGITNTIGTGESYTFSYSAAQALYEPFSGTQQFGTAVRLNSLNQAAGNLTTSFQYNASGEMTKVTLPLGGEMMWNYVTQSFADGRQVSPIMQN